MLAVVVGASTFETKRFCLLWFSNLSRHRQQDDSALENTFAVLKKLGPMRYSGRFFALELGYQSESLSLDNLFGNCSAPISGRKVMKRIVTG